MPNVQPGQILAPVKESFELPQAQALGRLGETIQQTADLVSKYTIEKAKKDATKEVLKREIGMRNKINGLLYSSDVETIETEQGKIERPSGVLNRRLSQTKDSAIDFTKKFNDLYEENTKGLNDYQRGLLYQNTTQHYQSSLNAVIQHQAREESRDYQMTYNATLDQFVSDSANYEDPDDIKELMNRATLTVIDGMKTMGASDPKIIGNKVNDISSKIATKSILTMLEKNPDKAKLIFEKIKDKLPADTREALNVRIQDKQFTGQRDAIWKSLSDAHKQNDGSYDMESFRDEIDELPNYTPEQKGQLYSYMEGRARDAEQTFKNRQAVNYKNFMNEAVGLKDQKVPFDEIMKIPNKYAATPAERVKMENDIKKLYSNIKTNPETYTSLYQQLKTGELTEKHLEDYSNQLSGSDYEMFKKGLVDQIVNPKSNVAYKDTMSSIKVMIDKKYGSNKTKKNDFYKVLYQKHEEAGGQSADQLMEMATDLLEKVKVNSWPIIGKKPKFEVSAAKIKEDRAFKATLENELGRDLVYEIGRSMMIENGNKSINPNNLREFVDKFGGYDKIKPGTKTYKAIKLLQENEMLITPATVEKLIQNMNKLKTR